MNRRKVIIDCDPGIDDAVMLCLAAAFQEQLEILAVTTVAGNQTIEKVSENARKVIDFLNLKVPVAVGMETHLLNPVRVAEKAHGEDGLGGVSLPPAVSEFEKEHAVLYLNRKIMEQKEKITLIVTGPCTNIAMLFRLFPQVKERIDQIVLMGGGVKCGNCTAAAEFNIYEDPEAAQIVFQSGVPIVMAGLDVTWQCGLTRRQIEKLCQMGGKVGRFCGDMAGYAFENSWNDLRKILPLHDAVTVMYLVHPELFDGERAFVEVDCSNGPDRGRTICDFRWWKFEREPQVQVLMYADSRKFQELLIEAFYSLDEKMGNFCSDQEECMNAANVESEKL